MNYQSRESVAFLKPCFINNINEHTMEKSLYQYTEMKVHEKLLNEKINKILVIGKYDRENSFISIKEKKKIYQNIKIHLSQRQIICLDYTMQRNLY